MKAQDLRIGNWVKQNDFYYQVTAISTGIPRDQVSLKGITEIRGNVSLDVMQPINLTPEWLERGGFDREKGVYVKPLSDTSNLRGLFSRDGFSLAIDDYAVPVGDRETVSLRTLKYVHQLQNLYHALTHSELEFK